MLVEHGACLDSAFFLVRERISNGPYSDYFSLAIFFQPIAEGQI